MYYPLVLPSKHLIPVRSTAGHAGSSEISTSSSFPSGGDKHSDIIKPEEGRGYAGACGTGESELKMGLKSFTVLDKYGDGIWSTFSVIML